MSRRISKLAFNTLLRPTLALGIVGTLAIVGCGKKLEDAAFTGSESNETAQQVGDVMASLDESGGSSSGAMAEHAAAKKIFARLLPGIQTTPNFVERTLIPNALAATCAAASFSSCENSSKVRSFNACTLGSATMTGSVTVTFSGADCLVDGTGETATRVPDFTISGPRGGNYSVSKTGSIGQRLTRTGASSFSFSNDGIRRVASFKGTTIFDFTTSTTSDLLFSGATRATRSLTGGTLRVTNNLKSESCDYTPDTVNWTAGCNCPTSGTWTSSCTDATKNSTLTMTSTCGSATLTVGGVESTVTLDRCI